MKRNLFCICLFLCLMVTSIAALATSGEIYTFADIPWDTSRESITDVTYEKTGIVLDNNDSRSSLHPAKNQPISFANKSVADITFYGGEPTQHLRYVNIRFKTPSSNYAKYSSSPNSLVQEHYNQTLPLFYELRDILNDTYSVSPTSYVLLHENPRAYDYVWYTLEAIAPDGNWETVISLFGFEPIDMTFRIEWNNVYLTYHVSNGYSYGASATIELFYNDNILDHSNVRTSYTWPVEPPPTRAPQSVNLNP